MMVFCFSILFELLKSLNYLISDRPEHYVLRTPGFGVHSHPRLSEHPNL